jgi:bifunctional DNA-binding transcriptional regulator/antitoxin component of YhaV-PrlF toxin-antitoxin module
VGEFRTKATTARPNSPSLRTTIPEGVAKLIDLEAGDELLWKIEIKENRVEISVSKTNSKK